MFSTLEALKSLAHKNKITRLKIFLALGRNENVEL